MKYIKTFEGKKYDDIHFTGRYDDMLFKVGDLVKIKNNNTKPDTIYKIDDFSYNTTEDKNFKYLCYDINNEKINGWCEEYLLRLATDYEIDVNKYNL